MNAPRLQPRQQNTLNPNVQPYIAPGTMKQQVQQHLREGLYGGARSRFFNMYEAYELPDSDSDDEF